MKTIPYLTAIVRYFYSQSIFTAFLFGVIISPKLFASGGWTGNGGFTTLEQNNPWFLGVGKIPYCVKVNKKFSINTGAVAYLIGQSSRRWADFFNLSGGCMIDGLCTPSEAKPPQSGGEESPLESVFGKRPSNLTIEWNSTPSVSNW